MLALVFPAVPQWNLRGWFFSVPARCAHNLFPAQILVDRLCARLAGAHREDDGGRFVDGVAAREDALLFQNSVPAP